MAYLNRCEFIGNLGANPESVNKGDMPVVKLSVAVTFQGKPTIWTKWKLFDKQAIFALKYLKSGDSVYISGRYECDKTERGENELPLLWPKFVADSVQKIGSSKKNSNAEIEFVKPTSTHQKSPIQETIPMAAYNEDFNSLPDENY